MHVLLLRANQTRGQVNERKQEFKLLLLKITASINVEDLCHAQKNLPDYLSLVLRWS